MKRFLKVFSIIFLLSIILASVTFATENTDAIKSIDWNKIFIIVTGVIGIAEIIVRLTPTENDNSIFNLTVQIVLGFFDIVLPNRSKSPGEKFTLTNATKKKV